MTEAEGQKSTTRVIVGPGSIALVIAAVVTAIVAAQIMVAARRVVSWTVACAVSAALIELLVDGLDRWMRRWVAIIVVLLGIAAIAGVLVFGVFHDLDREVSRLKTAAPVAAESLEMSDRLGGVAREVRLEERVTSAVDDLSKPSSGLAGEAVSSVGTYAVCVVLTVLFLSWGPRVANGLLAQVDDERRALVRNISSRAFSSARSYVIQAIAQSTMVGVIGWAACIWADVRAPVPLALALAVMSLVPNLGIIVGALPILLLAAGLGPMETAIKLAVLFVALQFVSSVFIQPLIVRRSGLYVGPAIVAIAFMLGFELYGFGGALYCAALLTGVVAAIDATAQATEGAKGAKQQQIASEGPAPGKG